MEYIDLSILALTIAKEIYCNNDKNEIFDYIKFFELINSNLRFLLYGKDKDNM